MRFIKKYGFAVVFAIVFAATLPFVINSFIEKMERTEGLSEPTQTAVSENSPQTTPDTQNTPNQGEENTPTVEFAVTDTPNITPDMTQNATPDVTVAITKAPAQTAELRRPDTNGKTNEYFDDALFIGDSRTEGIKQYGTIKNADFYSYVGLSVYKIDDKNNPSKSGTGMTFDEYISHKQYKKIYLMLGFNEVGYPKNNTVKKYREILNRIQSAQPDATVYLCANLLVTAECSKTDKYSHNPDLIQLNSMISQLADGEKLVYIDVNELFGDGMGNLRDGISGDGTHLYAKYYPLWCDWLLSKAI